MSSSCLFMNSTLKSAATRIFTLESDVPDGFDVILDGQHLVGTRALTREESGWVRQELGRKAFLGYLALFGITVVVPFLVEFLWPLDPFAGILTVIPAIYASVLGIKLLPNALNLRRPLTTVWIFRGHEEEKRTEYLPEVGTIWKESFRGQSITRFKQQKPVRVARVPIERQNSLLTMEELLEIGDTLRAQRFFPTVQRVVAPLIAVMFALSILTQVAFTLFEVRLCLALIITAETILILHQRRFLSGLRGSVHVVTDGPDEFLSSGVPWTHRGHPAKWRHDQPSRRTTNFQWMGP